MIFRGGTCVSQTQVTSVDLREVTGDGELGSKEAVIEDKAKLSMMWNVCGWCREGSGMEQMREQHDMAMIDRAGREEAAEGLWRECG